MVTHPPLPRRARPARTRPLVGLLASFALAGVGSLASAQTSTTPPATSPTSVGSCSGSITATIGLAAKPDGANQSLQSINAIYAPYTFGKAECDCDPSEDSGEGIYMRLQVSSGLMQGTATNVTAWVGTGCDDYSTRNNTSSVQCVPIHPSNLVNTSFNSGSGNIGTSVFYDLYVPSRQLFSPQFGTCTTNASNSIWIFLGLDQSMPDGTCQVTVSEQATGPTPAFGLAAASGDGAVTVSWQAPSIANTDSLIAPTYYQILCADDAGNAIPGTPGSPIYSTCESTGLHRRQNIFGASDSSTSTDGGTTTVTDAGVSATSFSARVPSSWPSPALVDAGVDAAVASDMTITNPTDTTPRPTSFPGIEPFDTLDPKFICSGLIDGTASATFSNRIKNLTNNTKYNFMVLAIDQYGNPTPGPIVSATPQPVDDLYARYREDGGGAHGFCFVATAAFGDYDHPQVRLLREFRDEILAQTAAGRAFIRGYYASSPPLAAFIARSTTRRFIARGLLWPVVGVASLALRVGSLGLALLLTFGLPTLVVWLRRRRLRLRRRAFTEVQA